jgi:hypothetical protein
MKEVAMGCAFTRIARRYPALEPELEALMARYPDLQDTPLFLNTLWAILDECPQAFTRPLPPQSQGDAALLQTLMYLKNRKPTMHIVGWLADYQQKMQTQAMRFAGNLGLPGMNRESLDLLLRCAARIAEDSRRSRAAKLHRPKRI